jgi:hypothetical protein
MFMTIHLRIEKENGDTPFGTAELNNTTSLGSQPLLHNCTTRIGFLRLFVEYLQRNDRETIRTVA